MSRYEIKRRRRALRREPGEENMKKQEREWIRVEAWNAAKPSRVVQAFLGRPSIDAGADRVAREVLQEIRTRGEAAVLDCIARLTGSRCRRVSCGSGRRSWRPAEARWMPHSAGRCVKRIAALPRFQEPGRKRTGGWSRPLGVCWANR